MDLYEAGPLAENPAWTIQETTWPLDAAAAVARYAGAAEVAWLDGETAGTRAASLVCCRPQAVLEQFEGQPARLRVDGRVRDEDASGWRLWRRWQDRLGLAAETTLPLSPGWVGHVGFEMARLLERLPASRHEDTGLPLLRMALYDCGIVLDWARRQAFAVRAPEVANLCDAADRDPDWVTRWEEATATPSVEPSTVGVDADVVVEAEMSRAAYEAMIERAREYIRAGDIYQVNLAQRFRLSGLGEPLSVYRAIRRVNPAPYSALLRWDGGAILSASPELFLSLRGRDVVTRPIKGTRPRGSNPVRNETWRRELIASEKEAAELVMIVDLHRNDIGRVCRLGSVQVRHARQVEEHPTVFHTVAEVVGELRAGCTALDLLEASFPAGSISGVPKIRALEIIDELEPAARGAYTGAIGVLGLDGNMTFNVAIRTLQMGPRAATLSVGGGIVADSEPAAEYAETLAKARGIRRGITRRAEREFAPLEERTCHTGSV